MSRASGSPAGAGRGRGVGDGSGGFVADARVCKWRRPGVAVERCRLLVAAAVPEGSVLAARGSVWLEAVELVLGLERVRADHAATGLGVARALCSWVDGASRTTRVTNRLVVECLRGAGIVVSVRTVQRWLRRLEAWGLLGLVAQGRSARWAPRVREEGAGGVVRVVRRNEAAVRCLCVPERVVAMLRSRGRARAAGVRAVAGGAAEVGRGCGHRCHPYPLSGIDDPRTRARGAAGEGVEPLRGAEAFLVAASRPPAGAGGRVRPAWWSSRRTRSGEEAVIGLARRLQDELVVLRGCTDRYVMRVIRPFFEAGWGVRDLVWAVDRRPDGGWWPHSGARGVREPARWLIHRLSAWLDEHGGPLEGVSQAGRAEHARVLADRRARWAREAAERERVAAERAGFPGGASPARARARALAAGCRPARGRGRGPGSVEGLLSTSRPHGFAPVRPAARAGVRGPVVDEGDRDSGATR